MPPLKRPHVASAEQVRIRRDGDAAVIEYAEAAVATTSFMVGKKKLAKMTDAQVLALWNEGLAARDALRDRLHYTATEIPVGKPQLEFFAPGRQWTPRGQIVRCQLLSDAGIAPALDEPFVSIDDRDFTLAEFMTLVGTYGGWGMRLEFVPDDELHLRPRRKLREPPAKNASPFRR